MTFTIQEIYRVVCIDNYNYKSAETHWTTDKQACEEYIENSYYKHLLYIEKATLCSTAVRCN
ncbi:hypothetical protein J6O48_03355 [bacterium]|nr:hypothetical protein [bacterium]